MEQSHLLHLPTKAEDMKSVESALPQKVQRLDLLEKIRDPYRMFSLCLIGRITILQEPQR